MKRIAWIDSAKGIAILLIILGHVGGNLEGFINFRFVYGFHLVVFFVLSGYTIRQKPLSSEYINGRFRRLMIPYFLTCLAVTVMDVFNSYRVYHDASIKTITRIIADDLKRSFFASGSVKVFGTIDIGTRIGAIWFLPALFFAIIIFRFLLSKTNNYRTLGILSVCVSVIGYLTARFIWLPFSVQSGMFAVFFLWIGFLVKEKDILRRIKPVFYLFLFLVLVLGIIFGFCSISFVTATLNDPVFSLITGLSGCFLVFLLAQKLRKNNVFSYLGRISLLILCTHLFALETMDPYFNKITSLLSLQGNACVWATIVMHMVFAIGLAIILEKSRKLLRRIQNKNKELFNQGVEGARNQEIDITRGFFIILMLVGHFSIDTSLYRIIYSCHMVVFILFSGYFFNPARSLKYSIVRTIKGLLLPYFVFVIAWFGLHFSSWNAGFVEENLKRYLLGMSFSGKLFTDIASVGPVYFLLLLFLTRIIYLFIARIFKKEWQCTIAVLCVSVLGVLLGRRGLWLPWSFDVACYCLAFYHIGVLIRKHRVLELIKKWNISYFILSSMWVFMIYSGSMEIAMRNYGDYGVVLLGAVSGSLLVFAMANYIAQTFPAVSAFLRSAGRYSMIILVTHALFRDIINGFVGRRFSENSFALLVISVFLQVIIGILIGIAVRRAKTVIKRVRTDV